MSMHTIFLDSSIIFSAVYSPVGGSAKLFSLTNIKRITSTVVVTEVERNVREKLTDIHLDRFFMLMKDVEIIAHTPDDKKIALAKKVIVEKDAVILAEAKESSATYVASLDLKHFFTDDVARFIKPKKIVTPKKFFEIYD